jgi:hypothetical protein
MVNEWVIRSNSKKKFWIEPEAGDEWGLEEPGVRVGLGGARGAIGGTEGNLG